MIGGVQDPATLEAIACREALALAADLHLQHFVIASDSKQVRDINNGSRGSYKAIINEINLQATLFTCTFTFESRSINVEAHSLAKFSLRRHVWFGQPHDPICIPQTVVYDE